ncbi:hypothetical protein LTR05_002633 [Lithohypha guttulata]|uniref:Pyridoxamine 5'-phosphate oxidase putative domain-containing protein n=1 Tax=Lithohypha guttulata TaxID=1690604 RepID=A0AAN7T305_9EURO|nr:hypothetical protein LTR05_002633 [Lithohypha guttulata]
MGVYYEVIPPSLQTWIMDQKCFWVGSAPLSGKGHINISPKGGQYFGIIDEKTFWYQDLSGSGNETISHLHEPGNGRIVIMFNAFEGPPKIVRLWGYGRVLEYGTPAFKSHVEQYKVNTIPGTRSIIMVDIHQVGGSCGWSVPYYDFKDYRPVLNDFFEKKQKKFEEGAEKEDMDRYWAWKSAWSMDGLPGMKRGLEVGKREHIEPLKKMVGPLAPKNGFVHSDGFTLEQVIVVFIVAFIAGIMAVTLSPAALKNVLALVPGHSRNAVWLPKSLR